MASLLITVLAIPFCCLVCNYEQLLTEGNLANVVGGVLCKQGGPDPNGGNCDECTADSGVWSKCEATDVDEELVDYSGPRIDATKFNLNCGGSRKQYTDDDCEVTHMSGMTFPCYRSYTKVTTTPVSGADCP